MTDSSWITIANGALMAVAKGHIDSFNDATNPDLASTIETLLPQAIYSAITEYRWKRITKRVSLSPSAEAESQLTDDGKNSFTIPTDLLYVVDIQPDDVETRGPFFYSASDEVLLDYVALPEKATDLPIDLQECVRAALAALIAIPLTGSTELYSAMSQVYASSILKSRSIDTSYNIKPKPVTRYIDMRQI